jgi:N-acetylneuraminic acid mutarotase
MITLRNHFSLVNSDKYVYIIGGENHKEGVLTKCEKFSLDTKTVSIIKYIKIYLL